MFPFTIVTVITACHGLALLAMLKVIILPTVATVNSKVAVIKDGSLRTIERIINIISTIISRIIVRK
jgi:hypothetical protein